MKIELKCPHARYNDKMRIECTKTNGLCGNQRFKPCKGWCVLTEFAAKCPLREEK